MDPLFPIMLFASFTFPPNAKPQPTTANTPAGINGHQMTCENRKREATAIRTHPTANHTSMVPVWDNALAGISLLQAKKMPGPVVTRMHPGMTNPNHLLINPHKNRETPSPRQPASTKCNRLVLPSMSNIETGNSIPAGMSGHNRFVLFMPPRTTAVKIQHNPKTNKLNPICPVIFEVLAKFLMMK